MPATQGGLPSDVSVAGPVGSSGAAVPVGVSVVVGVRVMVLVTILVSVVVMRTIGFEVTLVVRCFLVVRVAVVVENSVTTLVTDDVGSVDVDVVVFGEITTEKVVRPLSVEPRSDDVVLLLRLLDEEDDVGPSGQDTGSVVDWAVTAATVLRAKSTRMTAAMVTTCCVRSPPDRPSSLAVYHSKVEA